MVDGECITQKVGVILNSPTTPVSPVSIPANPFNDCCADFDLKVFADTSGKALQNDVNTVIWWFDAIVTGATLKLKKWVNGAWALQATISDNTYGTYGEFAYYTNSLGQNFISLQIEWAKVLAAFDEGSYKVTCTYTNPLGSPTTVDLDSHEYCLMTYTAARVDGTVRLEYWLSGTTGDVDNDTLLKDFGTLNIYNSFRLKGFFGYPKTTYKQEEIEYETGEFKYVEDYQTPVFEMTLLLLPFFIHEILRTDFMMADELAITDYNSKNNGSYIQKFVRKDSGYEPEWHQLQSNFATVKLKFRQAFNRFRKLRS